MTEKSKSECIESIAAALMRTSLWRSKLADKYPDDSRNDKAAQRLAELAEEAPTLTDGYWQLLKPVFNSSPTLWHEALAKAGRQVVFLHKKVSFAFLIRNLITLLSQSEPKRDEWKVAA